MLKTISFKGDQEKWNKFISKIKQNKKKVWKVLWPMLEAYIEQENSFFERFFGLR